MTLLEQVDQLRRLAMVDPETTTLEVAILGVLEDLAAAVDRLGDQGTDDQHLGSV